MKPLVVIACSLFLMIAGAASALEPCSQSVLADFANQQTSTSSDHHSHSHHSNSGDSFIHCPTVSEFVPTAIFSLKPNLRTDVATHATAADTSSQLNARGSSALDRGPPSLLPTGLVPSQILFSVWRI